MGCGGECPTQTTTSMSDSKNETAEQDILHNESRNILVLAAHHIVLRVAWIFKTESVIMPAFLDAIAGAGWLRGCLPVLNRVGQSVPPVVASRYLRNSGRKKWWLLLATMGMAVPFLAISLTWVILDDHRVSWLPPYFLVLYFLFFSITGIAQLTFGTLEGKLVRARRRGRLMAIAGIVGSVLAISFALVLLSRWLARPDGGYGQIFGFTAGGFLLSAFLVIAVREPFVKPPENSRDGGDHPTLLMLLKSNRDFMKLAIVAMLFVSAQLVFPHYQALGRQRPDFTPLKLMRWVVAQNAGAGFWAVIAGLLADRFGNRSALKMELSVAILTPVAALVLSRYWLELPLYWITFVLLGTVPTAFKTLANYTLELTDPAEHPRFLSLLRLCMAIPFVLSPLVGAMVDWFGFEPVFGGISVVLVAAAGMAWTLHEPRHQRAV